MSDNNIYAIDSWAGFYNYDKNKIITINNLYYYCNLPHTSSSSFATDLASNKWVGYISDRNEQKKYFTWLHAYNHPTDNQPKIRTIQFGDGYSQSLPDGINNILPVMNLEFECDLAEATAILHFLENCAGTESFVWLPPPPRGTLSRWICKRWSDAQPFYNNYKIQAEFTRSVT